MRGDRQRSRVGNDFTGQDNTLLTQKHGYIFEVRAGARGRPEPVRNAGRFARAAAYHRSTNAVYLTEDNFPNRTDDEFAGATFSPDHETLYCNIQASSGLTFAIWGPWGGGGI